MISDDDIQKVNAATDFVSLVSETVPVKQKGRDFWCCCPFHQEKTPSCKIDPAENLWHCFGCGEGGTVFTYVMKLHNVNFREAVHMLADRAHVDISDTAEGGAPTSEKNRLKECCKAACDFYHEQLLRGRSSACDNARKYVASRHFNIDVAKRWNLGFAPGNGTLIKKLGELGFTPDEMMKTNLAFNRSGTLSDRFFNRVMFPIFDIRGDCIAFGGRVLGKNDPKYLNSSETSIFHKSNVLFGLDKAKNSIVSTGYAVVVEGYTDVIACHEAGIQNVVATLGTSLTMQHIKLLSRYASKKIVYLFDGDEAGQRAAERALQFIDYQMTPEAGQARCDLHAATIPNNMDPAEYIEAKGADAMKDILENSGPLIEFGIQRRIAKHDLSTPEGRSRALVDAISILAPIKNSILAKDYATLIASMTRASESDAIAQLNKLQPPKKYEKQPDPAPANAPVPTQAPVQTTDTIDKHEQNRVKNERQIVALSLQHPLLALQKADDLISLNWHNNLNKTTVEKALSILSDDLQTTSTVLINRIIKENPKVKGVVTSAMSMDEEEAEENFAIILNNLILDDVTEKQENLNIQLASEFDNVKRAEILEEITKLAKKKAAMQANLQF